MGKEVKKKENEFSDAEILDLIGPDTRKKLVSNRAKLTETYTTKRKKKYSKKDPLIVMYFHQGYDLLQHNIVIRPFILKKYNIKNSIELDVLLYLFPIQFFTIADFKMLPLKQHNVYLKTLLELGYADLCVKKVEFAGNIYKLTDHAIRIVKDYYACLSGEKQVGTSITSNPFLDPKAAKIDKLRQKLLDKLKKQSETSPSKFRKNLY